MKWVTELNLHFKLTLYWMESWSVAVDVNKDKFLSQLALLSAVFHNLLEVISEQFSSLEKLNSWRDFTTHFTLPLPSLISLSRLLVLVTNSLVTTTPVLVPLSRSISPSSLMFSSHHLHTVIHSKNKPKTIIFCERVACHKQSCN